MQLDWFTFAAQIVNFLVLVWLLHRLLYRRLVRAMEEREERIAARFREAEEREVEAARAQASFRERERALDERREELLAGAREDAEQRRKELVREARAAAEDLERSWRRELERERETFLDGLRRETSKAALEVCRRALADLAGAELERQALVRFRRRLAELEGEERTRLAEVVAGAGELVVRSAFPLPADEREALAESLGRIGGGELPPLRVEVDPERGFGVELEAAGWKIGWSLESYLEGLEDRVSELLEPEGEGSALRPTGATAAPEGER